MVAMRMMQASIDEIIDVVAMRNRLVTASRPMDVSLVVADMTGQRVAAGRVGFAHFDHMLIDMIAMRMMKMSIVQIIDMVPVFYSQMAAARAVRVVVMLVVRQIAVRHENVLSRPVQ